MLLSWVSWKAGNSGNREIKECLQCLNYSPRECFVFRQPACLQDSNTHENQSAFVPYIHANMRQSSTDVAVLNYDKRREEVSQSTKYSSQYIGQETL